MTIQCDALLASFPMSAPALAFGLPDEDPVAQLEADFGGSEGWQEFVERSTPNEIDYVLSLYGIADDADYARPPPKPPSVPEDCPAYLPKALRGKLEMGGEIYHVDALGRPYKVEAGLPPIVEAKRNAACQRVVGWWGDQTIPGGVNGPDEGYDGGHILAAVVGGDGIRPNTVPMRVGLNRGPNLQVEKALVTCANLEEKSLKVVVQAVYVEDSGLRGLVPTRFDWTLSHRKAIEPLKFSFSNVDKDQKENSKNVKSMRDFVESIGCDGSVPRTKLEDVRSGKSPAPRNEMPPRPPRDKVPDTAPAEREVDPGTWVDKQIRELDKEYGRNLLYRAVRAILIGPPSEKENHR